MRQLKTVLKRIIVIAMVFITLMFFVLRPPVEAGKLPKDGEFYYTGTTKGTYVVTEGIFSWLLTALKGIADFIIGAISMLFRMVIVGWTALFEKLLTMTLEATMGTEFHLDNINGTDITENTNSSENVTVEAIVYNLVPFFNINLFEDNVEHSMRTGTGRDLSDYICERCEKNIDECNCAEGYCNCTLCQLRRFRENPDNKTVVDMVKENVAGWYYIIRLIAIAGMMIVLIAIGIKMAISTVASEKALYKRMLVDWIVGFIILFTMQYMMVAIININETLVTIIREAANSNGNEVTEITKKEFSVKEKTNEDLEISIYEAARTRAYDAKLINGTTGMVLYATLVFFAFRFSLMYLKRYLTIIALTLMAPGVGFAYAIQKALSGKSKAFGNWMKEYIMNVIIQTVHALLYSSFVSTALVVSLDSVSGMILAFILLNFMLKADKLFRKIFKMSSEGSLLDNASNSGDPQKIRENLQAAQALYMGAKPVTKALLNSPLTKAATGVAKAVRNEAILGIARTRDLFSNGSEEETESNSESVSVGAREGQVQIGEAPSSGAPTTVAPNSASQRTATNVEQAMDKSGLNGKEAQDAANAKNTQGNQQSTGQKSEEELLKEALYASQVAKDKRESNNGKLDADAEKEANKKWKAYHAEKDKNKKRAKQEGRTVAGAVGSHIGQLFDSNNYYRTAYDSEGKAHRVRIGSKYGTVDDKGNTLDKPWHRFSGVAVWNPKKGLPEIMSINDLVSNQLTSEQLFGLSKQDKKTIAEVSKFVATGLGGMAAISVGVGTFVANPKLGLPLLAGGAASTSKMLGRNLRKSKYGTESPHVFKFSRFGPGSQATIVNQIKSMLDDERRQLEELNENAARLLEADKGPVFDKSSLTPEQFEQIEAVYNRVSAERPGIFRRTVGDNFFGGITTQMDKVTDEMFNDIDKKEKEQKQVAIVMISDSLQREYTKQMNELEKSLQTDDKQERLEVEETFVATRSISSSKEEAIIERAIIEVAIADKKIDIKALNLNDETKKTEVKKVVEQKLVEAGLLEKGANIDEAFSDIDKKILDIKATLDKESNAQSKPEPAEQEQSFESQEKGTQNPIADSSQSQANSNSQESTSKEAAETVKPKLTKVEEVILQNVIREYINKNHITKKEQIKPDEILKEYNKKISEIQGKTKSHGNVDSKEEAENKAKVDTVLDSLVERKQAVSMEDIRKTLTTAAKKREKREVPKADKPEETMEIKQKDKDRKDYEEDKLIQDLKAGKDIIAGKKLSKDQSTKVMEILLLQKSMKKLNQEAIKAKMSPITETAYRRAQMVMEHDGGAEVDSSKTGDAAYVATKTRKENMTYGPVNDIIELINKKGVNKQSGENKK